MIKSTLFRKHFAIAAASVLGFVFLGAVASTLFIQRIIHTRTFQAPMFFVYAIEDIGKGDPIAGIKRVESYNDRTLPFRFGVLDDGGNVVYGEAPAEKPKKFPREIHETLLLGSGELGREPGGYLARLDHEPPLYLFIRNSGMGGPGMRPPPFPSPGGLRGPMGPPPIFPLTFIILVVTVLVGIGFALFLIFRSLRDHVDEADRVISELQKGNLKARFPVRKQDEIGRAMTRFNQMAEQIEALVERVRSAEASRNLLLQDLTHDLRTPVASMRSLLETIFSETKMDESIKELSDLALKENDYIARLVEDLLLLAQVSEPKYRLSQGRVDLIDLIEEEGEALALRKPIKFQLDANVEEALVKGDEQLLRRLVRNLLENAFSFARAQVTVTLRAGDEGEWNVSARDDGPGFDAETLARFGERRSQRALVAAETGRLSLGLGSVIMKTVATVHGGTIAASNALDGGAEVRFTLPREG